MPRRKLSELYQEVAGEIEIIPLNELKLWTWKIRLGDGAIITTTNLYDSAEQARSQCELWANTNRKRRINLKEVYKD